MIHTGPDTYAAMVNAGLNVQPVHAGMSRFAHPDEAWDLWWRPRDSDTWRRLSVGDEVRA